MCVCRGQLFPGGRAFPATLCPFVSARTCSTQKQSSPQASGEVEQRSAVCWGTDHNSGLSHFLQMQLLVLVLKSLSFIVINVSENVKLLGFIPTSQMSCLCKLPSSDCRRSPTGSFCINKVFFCEFPSDTVQATQTNNCSTCVGENGLVKHKLKRA